METPTGTPSGTRAAGDVGPSHAHMVPARSTHPMVGRDVLGAPRTRGRPRGRHQAHGPPGTSAPTTRHMVSAPTTAPHGRARRPRRATHTGTHTGTPSGTRATGDVGPYHAPHGRARRPRRAAHAGTPTGTPSGARAAEDVGPYHAHMVPAPTTAPHGRARRPRRAAHTGTPTGTPSGARAAGDVGPYHAPHGAGPYHGTTW